MTNIVFNEHHQPKKDKPGSSPLGGIHPLLLAMFCLLFVCLLYGVASIVFMFLKIDPLITLEDSPILWQGESEEIYLLLVTILLSLLATLVMAYIFMVGALQERKERKEYEKPALQKLQDRTTKQLMFSSAITSLCVVCIFIQVGKNFTIETISWFRYTLVLISFIDMIILSACIYAIINYEKGISNFAKKILIRCANKLKELGSPAQNYNDNVTETERLDKQLKMISDLEAIITLCARNHKASDRSRGQEIDFIFEKMDDKSAATSKKRYENLVYLKDMIQVLKDHGVDVESLPQLTDSLKKVVGKAVDEVCWRVKTHIMHEERFENLNFVDVDFSNGKFSRTSFRGAALINVCLTKACLCSACLADTVLRDVNFWDARCRNADFTGALVEISKIEINMDDDPTGDLTGAVFTNADLSGAKGLLNRKHKNQKFSMKKTMCRKTNFLESKLTGVDFEGSVLTDAQLSKTEIEDCSFKDADLERASLIEASLTCQSDFTDFRGANLSEVKAADAEFKGTRTSTLKFDTARLARASFTSAEFQHCDFVGAYMNDAGFVGATFKHCQFQGAILTCSDLSGCVMEDCRLDYATLSKALIVASPCKNEQTTEIIRTEFCHAHFSGAALRGYTFEGCDFTKAVFNDAVLRNVTFKNCVFHNSLFLKALMVDVYWIDCQQNTAGDSEDCIVFGTQEDRERYRRFSHGL